MKVPINYASFLNVRQKNHNLMIAGEEGTGARHLLLQGLHGIHPGEGEEFEHPLCTGVHD
jgi:hypothetical protein